MESPTDVSLKSDRVFAAYMRAVYAASLAFTLISIFPMLRTDQIANLLIGRDLFGLSIMMVALFVVGVVFAFCIALAPFYLGIAIARRFKILHWSYFVCGGTLTASLLCLLAATIPDLGINVQGDLPSFWQEYRNLLPRFMFCGFIAGTACWFHIRMELKCHKLKRSAQARIDL